MFHIKFTKYQFIREVSYHMIKQQACHSAKKKKKEKKQQCQSTVSKLILYFKSFLFSKCIVNN